ncbi:hypothetical protein AB3662_17325 [Sorangium cellulosum]|uniref:hypothetical protein n=1 Tax=Sorangium cellulosum TaxID=56 RepID=UPI003D9A0F00
MSASLPLSLSLRPRAPAPSVDATYRALLPELPLPLREVAARLPHRLGLTASPDGTWEDFVELPPNRDLPFYAAEDPARPGALVVSEASLDRYREAHHWAGVFGLVADRLADRQVAPDPALARLRAIFLRAWERALALATGDRRLARGAIADALAAWRRGVAAERRALALGALDPAAYAAITGQKLRWIAATSRCLVAASGDPARALLLQRAYDAFLFALQCRDDATDCAEDAAVRGTSIPAALGYPPGGLFRAAPKVARVAVALAEAGGFQRLASWIAAWARAVDARRAPGIPLQNELAGMIVAGAWEEADLLAAPSASPPRGVHRHAAQGA